MSLASVTPCLPSEMPSSNPLISAFSTPSTHINFSSCFETYLQNMNSLNLSDKNHEINNLEIIPENITELPIDTDLTNKNEKCQEKQFTKIPSRSSFSTGIFNVSYRF